MTNTSFSKLYVNIISCILFFIVSIIIIITINIFSITTNSFANPSQIDDKEFNIITTADVGCSLRAQENIKNIEKLYPELFLVAGDLSYERTPDCWFDMTKSLDSKTKIAIGNHDDYEDEGSKGEKLKKLYMDHYGINKSYYSFDYQNVHVLVLDTQLELSVDTLDSTAIINETIPTTDRTKNVLEEDKKEKQPLLERFPLVDLDYFLKQNSIDIVIPELDSLIKSNAKVPSIDVDDKQYQFVLDDLEKTSHNRDIDWIFVMFHKPMYSSLSKQFEEYIIRYKYHDIFDKYGVDLVIQGHNHIYSRTLPLSFNKLDITQPIIDQSSTRNNNIFTQPNGPIFLVVGVGGEELHRISDESYYIANEYNQGFGFVDLKIDGKRLDGILYDINLNCKLESPKKKGKETLDLDTCLPSPPSPTQGSDKLKVIDQFSIIKENPKN